MSSAATDTFLLTPLLRLKGDCRDCAGTAHIVVDLDGANTQLTAALSARFLKTRMRPSLRSDGSFLVEMRRHHRTCAVAKRHSGSDPNMLPRAVDEIYKVNPGNEGA